MSPQRAASLPMVLKLFAFLFSNCWTGAWQRNWAVQARAQNAVATLTPTEFPGKEAKPAKGQKAPNCARAKKVQERFYGRIFSLRVTLWYMIFQHLNFDQTLAAVVRSARDGGADRLSRRGRKISRRISSSKTSAYNEARQRLPLALLQAALAHLGQHLLVLVGLAARPKTKPAPSKRTRLLLDGSTLSILTNQNLAGAYPPASNQSGKSDWSLMRIVAGFCVRSGAILKAVEGAMQQSEQALAWRLIEAAAASTIWIGDRNFGVWSMVACALGHQQDVLVRMTRSRATKLAGDRPLRSGEERAVQWSPTRHDQTPPGIERKAMSGRLIYVRLRKDAKWIDLWLFTTLDADDYPVDLLVQWYGQRWQAELHFRSVKTHMAMDQLDVCSQEMARKEFHTGIIAYNLVRAVMWAAGERLHCNLHTISFSEARRVLLSRLQRWGEDVHSRGSWERELIEEVARQTLPKRRNKRPGEVRRVRHRRQKFPPLKGSRQAARARENLTKSL